MMQISARNVFNGKITKLISGPVNAELEITTNSGERLVSVTSMSSVSSLGLSLGENVRALVKAPWVILANSDDELRISARNQLRGTVTRLKKGTVSSEVTVTLTKGTPVHAVITNESLLDLGLTTGSDVIVLIKAGHLILAEPE